MLAKDTHVFKKLVIGDHFIEFLFGLIEVVDALDLAAPNGSGRS